MIGDPVTASAYPRIHVLRYMGTKAPVLDLVCPAIEALAPPGATVCDLMAGTHAVGYALKARNRIIANDIQAYSAVVGKALIENHGASISSWQAREQLARLAARNHEEREFSFFQDHYADKYFSPHQCRDIDSIRCAIEQIGDEQKRALYLCALMYAMCLAQSTTGHFAEFLPADHPRLRSLRAIDVWEAFLRKCDDMAVVRGDLPHVVLCEDYRKLLESPEYAGLTAEVDAFYLDPPYSDAQYSRFYHVLETVVRYDTPRLQYKGGYRAGRHQSRFSQRAHAEAEFDRAVGRIAALGRPLVISYSSTGLVGRDRLAGVCRSHYREVEVAEAGHTHSSQGKGRAPVREIVIASR